MKSLVLILAFISFADSAIAKPEPWTGRYIACGEILTRVQGYPLFLITDVEKPLPLTSHDPLGEKRSLPALLLKAIEKDNLRKICIYGIIFRNWQNAPQLMPLSMNTNPKLLNVDLELKNYR